MRFFIKTLWPLAALLPGPLCAQFTFYDSLNAIRWTQIEPPAAENFEHAQIVREGLGYLLSTSGTLYEYHAAAIPAWRRLPQPEGSSPILFFFANEADDIWAVVEASAIYKQVLFHWNGTTWQRQPSPNVQKIRSLVFASPEEGWLGCEYGELWHYLHGHWQQEALPTFIHVNSLHLTWNRQLYASCEAPRQSALLQRREGKWHLLWASGAALHLDVGVTPQNHLYLANGNYTSLASISLQERPAWLLPFHRVQFFPALENLPGYGIALKTVYLLHDTTFFPLVQTPVNLKEVHLFLPQFSWILGEAGFLLATQPGIPSRSAPAERVLGFNEFHLRNLYGLGILQEGAGQLSRLCYIQTELPNVVHDFKIEAELYPKIDRAAKLNLQGALEYEGNKGPGPANYDQALATGDLNGDGRDDLIVTSMYGHPFVYFHSGSDYYFDATAFSGLKNWGNIEQRPMLANLFDADHDGDLDLFIACQYRSNAFFVNDGRGRFTEITAAAGLRTEGGGIGGYVADFDGDGWEDLYVTCFNKPNLLYRNDRPEAETGWPRFENASAQSGEACRPLLKQSQGAAIADYDNDGDFDIFVCNLLIDNCLLQNDGSGVFKNVAQAAGLAGENQSIGAVFFDANHDGHLDLAVANRGFDRYYQNLGNGRFVEHTQFLGGDQFHRNLLLFPSRQFGSISYGTLAFDWQEDGDLDLLISNYDSGLFVFQNHHNAMRSALRLFPEGIVNNRSAVGTKIFLYETAGAKVFEKLVGARLIEAASGYGCSPPKMAHFGVDSNKIYHAKIIFPSGATREVLGLRGGDRLVVPELEGSSAHALKAQRALTNLLAGYRSRGRYLILLASLVLLPALFLLARKVAGFAGVHFLQLALVFGFVLLAGALFWLAEDEITFIVRPLFLGVAASVLMIFAVRFRRLEHAQPASLEMLQVRLHAFDHGSLIHQLLDRLVFYAENFEAGAELPEESRNRLREAASGAMLFLKHEIEAIYHYQSGMNFEMGLAHRLSTNWRKLKRALKRLHGNLSLHQNLEAEWLPEMVKLQRELRLIITELKRKARAHYRADAVAVAADFIRKLDHTGVRLLPAVTLPTACIVPEDLAGVLDELVQNALRHSEGKPAHVEVSLQKSFDEIQIDVRDNGCGISENAWEKIFELGFTTKKNGAGGFGLYHARQLLEKYGGRILIAASKMGEGTTMRICLKAEA